MGTVLVESGQQAARSRPESPARSTVARRHATSPSRHQEGARSVPRLSCVTRRWANSARRVSKAKPIQYRLNGDCATACIPVKRAVSPPGEQEQAMIGNTCDEGAAAAGTYVTLV
jgi:hypothetical protein